MVVMRSVLDYHARSETVREKSVQGLMKDGLHAKAVDQADEGHSPKHEKKWI